MPVFRSSLAISPRVPFRLMIRLRSHQEVSNANRRERDTQIARSFMRAPHASPDRVVSKFFSRAQSSGSGIFWNSPGQRSSKHAKPCGSFSRTIRHFEQRDAHFFNSRIFACEVSVSLLFLVITFTIPRRGASSENLSSDRVTLRYLPRRTRPDRLPTIDHLCRRTESPRA